MVNFDITYTGPDELLIANTGDLSTQADDGALYTSDLTTRTETVFVDDAQMACPISAAVTPRGGGLTYVADFCSESLFKLTAGSTTPELVAVAEPIAIIDGAWLNGFVVTPTGVAYLTDSSPFQPAVYKIDTKTGDLLATYTSPEFRNPEDVAIARNGDVYVVDSAFTQEPANHVPGLFCIPSGGGDIETLYQGDPLSDPVDILLTPFQGF